MENKAMEAPPLGVKPDFLVIPERNKELAEAVIRYCEYSECSHMEIKNFELMKRLAIEIAGNCNTQIKILEECKETITL